MERTLQRICGHSARLVATFIHEYSAKVVVNASKASESVTGNAEKGVGSTPASPCKRLHLGLFDTPQSAARAHDVALLKLMEHESSLEAAAGRSGTSASAGSGGTAGAEPDSAPPTERAERHIELNYDPKAYEKSMSELRHVGFSNFIEALKRESIFGTDHPTVVGKHTRLAPRDAGQAATFIDDEIATNTTPPAE